MIQAAEVTCLVCVALLISWLWRPRQAVEPGVWMLLISYALLGGWALWFGLYSAQGQEPAGFVFWKPTVMYWVLAIILIAAPLLGGGYPIKAIFGTFFLLSNTQWRWMNGGFAALFALLGGVNLLVAFNLSEGNWIGFKYSCMVNVLFILLFRLNFVWLDTVSRVVIYLYGRAKALFP